MAIDRAGVLRNAEKFIRQGKVDQAIAEYVRLVEDQPDDWTSANALGDLYIRNAQSDKAVAQYARIADAFLARGFAPKAAALYKKILKIKADDEHALSQAAEIAASQGLLVDARAHLNAMAAIARRRSDTAGAAAVALRLAALDPAEPGNRLTAARDAGMLSRVIELAVDAGLEDVLVGAQTRLVESHLAGGQAAQARFIAEDLVLRYPSDAAHRDRLRDVLRAMREPEPDEGSAADLALDEPTMPTPGSEAPVGHRHPPPAPPLTDSGQRIPIAQARHRSAGIEVDLSVVLDQMHKPIEPAEGPVDLDDVFARLRAQARRRSTADAAEKDLKRGVTLFQSGHIEESIPALEAAAKAPQCRFAAAAILGRIFLRRGVLPKAIEWLERAAEAPPRTAADGHAVLYDLAEALESTGDTTRAIALYLQLHADAGPFRDVPERIARLSGLRTGR